MVPMKPTDANGSPKSNPLLDDGPMTDDERADEAARESFPASDPPATAPHRHPKPRDK